MNAKNVVMKVLVKVQDVVSMARRFKDSPAEAMRDVVDGAKDAMREAVEQIMAAELELFLGEEASKGNRRNGFVTRTYAIKGIGTVRVRVPRDRQGKFRSNVIPAERRYDPALQQDLALLHLAGLSTRTLAQMSHRILGVRVSHAEVANSLHQLLPGAQRFL